MNYTMLQLQIIFCTNVVVVFSYKCCGDGCMKLFFVQMLQIIFCTNVVVVFSFLSVTCLVQFSGSLSLSRVCLQIHQGLDCSIT